MRRRAAVRDLKGSVVIITGASRGLGLALTRVLAKEGARLVLAARNEAKLKLAADDARALGGEAIVVPCDIRQETEVRSLVTETIAHYGRVDVVINNAGILTFGPFQALEYDDFRDAMDTMFWAPLYLTSAVVPRMQEQGGGQIVNIGSIGGKVATPHFLAYSSAKFAIVGFSEGLRTELRQYGIGVTTIVPGFMRTGAHYNATFKGEPLREYQWFRTASLAPLISTDADRAARRIAKAIRRNEREVVVGLQGRATGLSQRIAPSLTYVGRLLLARLLPRPNQRQSSKGRELEGRLKGVARLLSGRASVERHRQLDEDSR